MRTSGTWRRRHCAEWAVRSLQRAPAAAPQALRPVELGPRRGGERAERVNRDAKLLVALRGAAGRHEPGVVHAGDGVVGLHLVELSQPQLHPRDGVSRLFPVPPDDLLEGGVLSFAIVRG